MKRRVKDVEGCLTTYGIYEDCIKMLNYDLKKYPKSITKNKSVDWRVFSKVIKLYWKYVFIKVIDGSNYVLRARLGQLRVVKTLCTEYNPNRIGKEGRVEIDINKYGGYYHFVLFNSQSYKRYRIFPVYRIRKEYMDNVDDGMEFLDITR